MKLVLKVLNVIAMFLALLGTAIFLYWMNWMMEW